MYRPRCSEILSGLCSAFGTYRPRCSEILSGLCSAFGTCWVVQCHPSIESNPIISTTEHVHALYFLSHIGCTVIINSVKKSPKRCHSIGWKRPCDNQKFNRKEYFTKSPRVFQTATVRNLLTRQQSSKYYYQVCESSNSISCWNVIEKQMLRFYP